MTQIVILLTMLGIVGLYALATWFGQAAMVALLLLLPVIVGQCGLVVWQLVRRQSGRLINGPETDRWAKWLTIAYFVGTGVGSVVVDRYRLPPTPMEAPQLNEAEQELLTDCRISRGDPVEAVKAAYGVPYAPQKLERPTPAGTAYQYHFERYGTWVFFDDRLLVSSLRLDAPFRGAVQGVAIGDSADRLRAAKGPPVKQFQGFGIVGGSGSPVFTTAWVYAPENPSFIRYDILDGKVRSIVAYSCGPEIGAP